ncbi:hypothetical protein PRVXT_002522 [Proteinivorax tanatarense]|uniref:WYL domain-containing protein n=1 Tax=Proteinivorax tanatarense TaxID=1260629 RepID=A0AAU7VK53_9FIRM
MNFKKVGIVIDEIKDLENYEDLSYYALHLHPKFSLWRLFSGQWEGIPFYLQEFCNEIECILQNNSITIEEILLYLANCTERSSYFFVCRNLLNANIGKKLNEQEIHEILSSETKMPEEVVISREKICCAIAAYVLDTYRFDRSDLRLICSRERFQYNTTDYKLTKVKGIKFCSDGFIYDEKYYLYSIFVNREKLEFSDKMPAVFKILSEEVILEKADFFMRLDERLSIPLLEAKTRRLLCFEKFRGLNFNFNNTQLENNKNIIVHIDSENLNKLLMVIKKDYDRERDEEFWHIEIEELPYVQEDSVRDPVYVTFIHGKYYPNKRTFKHIDFTKNQYEHNDYRIKYQDTNSDIKIDYYTTKECHYKIWCVENINISEETWCKVVSTSLGLSYRKLFYEIIESGTT